MSSVNMSNESPKGSRPASPATTEHSNASSDASSINNQPSAAFVAALQLAADEHPPVSPRTAKGILARTQGVDTLQDVNGFFQAGFGLDDAAELLRSQQEINDMVRDTAYGLLATLDKRTWEGTRQLDRAHRNVAILTRNLVARERDVLRL